MPESPKFLLIKGRHDESLKILKMIYSKNTGDSPDKYKVEMLTVDDAIDNDEKKSFKQVVIQVILLVFFVGLQYM